MANIDDFLIRPAGLQDVPQLLRLMKELARFENYDVQFAVTEDALTRAGFASVPPAFQCFVATDGDNSKLRGMAVTYVIPWTYDLTPTLVLKELYITEGSRKTGIGQQLMSAVARLALEIGAHRIHWTVLPSNDPAKDFYRTLGGRPDSAWEPWKLERAEIEKLAEGYSGETNSRSNDVEHIGNFCAARTSA